MGNHETDKVKLIKCLRNFLEYIKNIWPREAPDINNVQKYVAKYKNEKIVIKAVEMF